MLVSLSQRRMSCTRGVAAAARCCPASRVPSTPRRQPTTARPAWRSGTLLVVLLLACGCNPFHRGPKLEEPVSLIAVMPIEPEQRTSATATGAVKPLPADAPPKVTAEVYAALTSSPKWRLVPDISVAKAIRRLKPTGDLASRARAVGKEVHADAVLYGTVSRYVEREGGEFGAQRPAAVAFQLHLISVQSGKILWNDAFEQTQQALSSNLFRWWQFWRGGPRWFTAQEFTRYGAEHMLKDLAAEVQ
jgi:hypothetical protein